LKIVGGTELNLYQYVQSQKSWQNAQQYCRDEFNGSIYDIEDNQPLTHIADLPETGKLWTGQYTTLSAWIANIGQFMHT